MLFQTQTICKSNEVAINMQASFNLHNNYNIKNIIIAKFKKKKNVMKEIIQLE